MSSGMRSTSLFNGRGLSLSYQNRKKKNKLFKIAPPVVDRVDGAKTHTWGQTVNERVKSGRQLGDCGAGSLAVHLCVSGPALLGRLDMRRLCLWFSSPAWRSGFQF